MIMKYISGVEDYADDEDNGNDGDDEDDQRWRR